MDAKITKLWFGAYAPILAQVEFPEPVQLYNKGALRSKRVWLLGCKTMIKKGETQAAVISLSSHGIVDGQNSTPVDIEIKNVRPTEDKFEIEWDGDLLLPCLTD